MIIIKDWIATIPEEDKHLGYEGENRAEVRQFLLCGKDWEKYKGWGFHLDMAFDLTSVTTRDVRQTEVTSVNSNEDVSEVRLVTTSTTRKETFTEEDVNVDCWSETDISILFKEVTEEGILLTWTVLRQHLLLPGVLRATLRAFNQDGAVKKSATMLFDVDTAVKAEAAAEVPLSEFEEMELRMDIILEETRQNAMDADGRADSAIRACQEAQLAAQQAEAAKDKLMIDLTYLDSRVDILTDTMENLHALSYEPQELDQEQKEQVKVNLGLAEDLTNLDSRMDNLTDTVENLPALTYEPQKLNQKQKEQVKTNLGLAVDEEMSHESANPVQNKVVYGAMAALAQDLLIRITELEAKQVTVDSALSMVSKNPVENQAITSYISKIETDMGTVETALDEILNIQQSLKGGGDA